MSCLNNAQTFTIALLAFVAGAACLIVGSVIKDSALIGIGGGLIGTVTGYTFRDRQDGYES